MKLLSQCDADFQAYFQRVYQDAPALNSPSEHVQQQTRDRGICSAYGELLYYSVQKIANRLQLTNKDVFCDLGSGLGKCALQIFMQTDVQHVIGIEADKRLVEKSLSVCHSVQHDFSFFWDHHRTLDLQAGNFLSCDWQNPTAIYACSTCYDMPLLTAIGDRINQTPSIRQALSLRPLPTLTRLKCVDIFRVECSWDSALCFHYRASDH